MFSHFLNVIYKIIEGAMVWGIYLYCFRMFLRILSQLTPTKQLLKMQYLGVQIAMIFRPLFNLFRKTFCSFFRRLFFSSFFSTFSHIERALLRRSHSFVSGLFLDDTTEKQAVSCGVCWIDCHHQQSSGCGHEYSNGSPEVTNERVSISFNSPWSDAV